MSSATATNGHRRISFSASRMIELNRKYEAIRKKVGDDNEAVLREFIGQLNDDEQKVAMRHVTVYFGSKPFPNYAIQNAKARESRHVSQSWDGENATVIEMGDEARIVFPEIPGNHTRKKLKELGLSWNATEKAWIGPVDAIPTLKRIAGVY